MDCSDDNFFQDIDEDEWLESDDIDDNYNDEYYDNLFGDK